jgi:hypothetical protein
MEEKRETAVEGLGVLETVNLSYQELSDEYQVAHFLHALKSLRVNPTYFMHIHVSLYLNGVYTL